MALNHEKLFRIAAVVNIGAGVPLMVAPVLVAARLGLVIDPASMVFAQVAGLAIAAFGALYWIAANNPPAFRPVIAVGMAVKLGVVGFVAINFAIGAYGWKLPTLISADIVFSVLFYAFLRETKEAGA
ncbi:MAG: hypothetical protein HWE25_01105 [Alphaproteobacteria bacterium]|nr:hypothetical protein [Alphaproteobacteria bacterium]